MNNQITVSLEFVIAALESRYEDVKELWGCKASHELWGQALQLVEECGLGGNINSPSVYVDNYLINGEFVERNNFYKSDCTRYGIELDEDQENDPSSCIELTDEQWELVTEDALIYNDDYACLQF